MGRRRADLLSGAVMLACGTGLCIRAGSLGLGHAGEPGPGFTIFLASALLALFSLLLMVASLWRPREETEAQPETIQWREIFFILFSLIAYGLVLTKLGFVLSTFLLVLALLKLMERKKWWVAVACGTMVALGTYMVFEVWLQARLPRGFLGF